MLVKDAMVGEVVSCTPGSSLQDIAISMWNNDCGCIPVVDSQEYPVGIVTDRDIAMAAALKHKPLWDITVEEVTADRKVICCESHDSLQDAVGMMEQHEVRRLPVVNQYGQLCGMLTMGDILSFTRAVRSRSKKSGNSQIDAAEIMGFLKHVSAHHKPHRTVLAS